MLSIPFESSNTSSCTITSKSYCPEAAEWRVCSGTTQVSESNLLATLTIGPIHLLTLSKDFSVRLDSKFFNEVLQAMFICPM